MRDFRKVEKARSKPGLFPCWLRAKFRTQQQPKKFRGARINTGCFALARAADGERESGADAGAAWKRSQSADCSRGLARQGSTTKSGLR